MFTPHAIQTVMRYTPWAISVFIQISAFESRYLLVLHPILLKLHILARLIESSPTLYSLFYDQISTLEGRYFLVLRPILLKLHISVYLIESFSVWYGLCSCIEKFCRSLYKPIVLHTCSHLTPIRPWWGTLLQLFQFSFKFLLSKAVIF